jgi:tetratricopeptide (TPR) repeat protein
MEAPAPSSESLLTEMAAALRAGDLDRASALAQDGLNRGLRHPLIFTAQGAWLAGRQRHEEALVAFSRADTISSPNAATKSAIGVTLAELGRFDDAIAAFEQAIALSPQSPQLYVRLAWVHELARNLPESRKALSKALELQPGNAAALGRLAFVEARSGAWESARSAAAEALAKDETEVKAHLALGMTEVEFGSLDIAEIRLNNLLATGRLGLTDRYLALGLMGDVRDRQNRIDDAVHFYDRANELKRSAHSRSQSSLLDAVVAISRYVETIKPRAPAAKPVAERGPAAGHVFLLGFLRSGTTLIQQILAAHPAVASLEEKDTLAEATRAFLARASDLEKLWAAPESELARHRTIYWNRVRELGGAPDGKIFVDKVPINSIKLPLISALFPSATVLFALRDPRDVVLSCYRRRLGANPATNEFYSIESTARFYDAVMRLTHAYLSRLSIPIHQIRHEALVNDFDAEVRRICDLIEAPWNERMRRFAESPGMAAVTTPSAMQLVRGLSTEGIGRWRRYRRHLEPVLPLLAFWVEKFHYDPE